MDHSAKLQAARTNTAGILNFWSGLCPGATLLVHRHRNVQKETDRPEASYDFGHRGIADTLAPWSLFLVVYA